METIETGVMVFRCELLRSKLPLSQCVANWKRSNEPPERPKPGGFTKIPLSECKDCPLGAEHNETGKFRSGIRTEAMQTQVQKPVVKTPIPMPRQEVIHVPIESMRRPEPPKRTEPVERPIVVEQETTFKPMQRAEPERVEAPPVPEKPMALEDLNDIHKNETEKRRLADLVSAIYERNAPGEQARVELRRVVYDFTKIGTLKELSDRTRIYERSLTADLNFQTKEEKRAALLKTWGADPRVIRIREIVDAARREVEVRGGVPRYGEEIREIVTDIAPLFPSGTALAETIGIAQSMIGTWIRSVERERKRAASQQRIDELRQLEKVDEPDEDEPEDEEPEVRFEDYAPKAPAPAEPVERAEVVEHPFPSSFAEEAAPVREEPPFLARLENVTKEGLKPVPVHEEDQKLKGLHDAIVAGMRSTEPLKDDAAFDRESPFAERHEGSQRQDLAALIARGEVRILPREEAPEKESAPEAPPQEHPAVAFGREAFLPYMPGRMAPGPDVGVGTLTHPFRLRKDLVVHLQLPEDLTKEEAARLQAFIGLLVF